MNSFIAWIGGKRLLRKAIIERFPEEGFDRYIEVFGGAGWVLFGKEVGKELEVFNDATATLSICTAASNTTVRNCRRNLTGWQFQGNSSLTIRAS